MKPKLLIVGDSPFIDTGFGRVHREIGMGLYQTGRWEVTSLGWFHDPQDKLIPWEVISTIREMGQMDAYGEQSYDRVVAQVRPDIVLVIGDEWMIEHIAKRPRTYKLLAYVPIDSAPILPSWIRTFQTLTRLVVYGDFAEQTVRKVAPHMPLTKINHGVDINVFRPLLLPEKQKARAIIGGDKADDLFIVGCVSRNNPRKQLPRLFKAFSRFVRPGTTCPKCGHVTFGITDACTECGNTDGLITTPGKRNALLYMHTPLTDSAGHDLLALVERNGLQGRVGFPDGIGVGRGVDDEMLNMFYNALDLFTLPTSAEGWGLPILEAMAAGCPVLVTEYSGHVEFVRDAGEFISVADWDTCGTNSAERALVDLFDYTMKLDRFYYEPEAFLKRWGPFLKKRGGWDDEHLAHLDTGYKLRFGMGERAVAKAAQYQWAPLIKQWDELLASVLPPQKGAVDQGYELALEVL